jgi:hypothetical protein
MPVLPTAKVLFAKVSAPVFLANIPHLGLLGSTLAADVVAVLGRADGEGASVDVSPMTHEMIAGVYDAHEAAMKHWRQDLYHVAIRLDAIVNGRPDPGSLTATEEERRKGT